VAANGLSGGSCEFIQVSGVAHTLGDNADYSIIPTALALFIRVESLPFTI